jgi:NADH dehydrogenase [ubiquinone] 1 alpha subcomplex assembly factor 7
MIRAWKSLTFTDFISGYHLVEPSPFMRDLQFNNLQSIIPNLKKNEQGNLVEASNGEYKFFWYDNLALVPSFDNPMIIAHEVFDAFPIHQFKKTENGWNEVLVDFDDSAKEFTFCLSKNPHVDLILSDEEKNLPFVEISPESIYYINEIAKRLSNGGQALVIDYGKFGNSQKSFRGVKNHAFVSPLTDVGNIDLTADVNFEALANSVKKLNNGVDCFFTNQNKFLKAMGIEIRLKNLLKSTESSSDQRLIIDGFKRICHVDNGCMGDIYKVMMLKKPTENNYPFMI